MKNKYKFFFYKLLFIGFSKKYFAHKNTPIIRTILLISIFSFNYNLKFIKRRKLKSIILINKNFKITNLYIHSDNLQEKNYKKKSIFNKKNLQKNNNLFKIQENQTKNKNLFISKSKILNKKDIIENNNLSEIQEIKINEKNNSYDSNKNEFNHKKDIFYDIKRDIFYKEAEKLNSINENIENFSIKINKEKFTKDNNLSQIKITNNKNNKTPSTLNKSIIICENSPKLKINSFIESESNDFFLIHRKSLMDDFHNIEEIKQLEDLYDEKEFIIQELIEKIKDQIIENYNSIKCSLYILEYINNENSIFLHKLNKIKIKSNIEYILPDKKEIIEIFNNLKEKYNSFTKILNILSKNKINNFKIEKLLYELEQLNLKNKFLLTEFEKQELN